MVKRKRDCGSPERTKIPRVIPRSGQARMTCVFLVVLPMLGLLSASGLWVYRSKVKYEEASKARQYFQDTTVKLGNVVVNLDNERDLTGLYITGRTHDVQYKWKDKLDVATRITDQSVSSMGRWPGSTSAGYLYPSRMLFKAVLRAHREKPKEDDVFVSEIQFFIDAISDMAARATEGTSTADKIRKWLTAYGNLLIAANFLGAEQTLCSILYSVICFSYQETYFYLNVSYSAEAAFRTYRRLYPGDRDADWRTLDHSRFFPSLTLCRREVFNDRYHQGLTIDPSLCNYSRRNETRFSEVNSFIAAENDTIVKHILPLLEAEVDEALSVYTLNTIILGALGCYFILMHLLRCSCITCTRRKRQLQNRRPSDADESVQEPLAIKPPRPPDEVRNHVTFSDHVQTDTYIARRNYTDLVPIKVATV